MQPHLDTAYWLGLLISVVLPVFVGLVTTRVTHPGIQAVLLLALTAATGFLTEWAGPHPDGYSIGSAVILWAVSFGTGVLSHFGLWRPTTIAARAQAVGTRGSVDLAA